MITSIAAIERGIANAVRNGYGNNTLGTVCVTDKLVYALKLSNSAVINSHSIVFKSGRVDAPDCLDEAPFTDVTRDFPAPTMTGPEVFDYFDTSFNFNSDEVGPDTHVSILNDFSKLVEMSDRGSASSMTDVIQTAQKYKVSALSPTLFRGLTTLGQVQLPH